MYSDFDMPLSVPKNALESLTLALIPPKAPRGGSFTVVVSLKSEELVARDLSGYLTLLDHVYGRLDPSGLSSYAHRKEGHLAFNRVRVGSLEFILSDPIPAAERLAIVYIVAKFLPVFIRELVASYRDLQEGRLAQIRRKKIEEEMQRDEQLKSLSDRHRKQLALLVDQLLILERQQLPSAQRFTQEQIIKIRVEISKQLLKEEDDQDILLEK